MHRKHVDQQHRHAGNHLHSDFVLFYFHISGTRLHTFSSDICISRVWKTLDERVKVRTMNDSFALLPYFNKSKIVRCYAFESMQFMQWKRSIRTCAGEWRFIQSFQFPQQAQ